MSYGTRYMESSDFVRYCDKLNLSVDEAELEHYEESGVMYPVLRLLQPEEYVRDGIQWLLSTSAEVGPSQTWPDMERLVEPPRLLIDDYAKLSDAELTDPFDRELGRNPYLVRPGPGAFKRWDSFNVAIKCDGYTRTESLAKHYYSYWQAHHVRFLQQFPDLHANRRLICLIPTEERTRHGIPFAPIASCPDFDGLAQTYDALGAYVHLYNHEHERSFAGVPDIQGVRTLTDPQYQSYLIRLSGHARAVANSRGLTEARLYAFLGKLLDIHRAYLESERERLAEELSHDIVYLSRLISVVSGVDGRAICEELGRSSIWRMREFRSLDPDMEAHDGALEVLQFALSQYSKEVVAATGRRPIQQCPEAELARLLDYCGASGLDELPASLASLSLSESEAARLSRRTQFLAVRNLATCFEYMLKPFGSAMNSADPPSTLGPLVQGLLVHETGLRSLFCAGQGKGFTRAKSPREALSNYTAILGEPGLSGSEDAIIARSLLLACLVRNLTVHNYPADDWFYGQPLGTMLRGVQFSIMYAWNVAKRERWV
jgi:hypothetical protein